MQAKIDQLSGHYLVCGAGRIGGYVLDELDAVGLRHVVVEFDHASVERRLEQDPRLLILEGDAADDDVLKRAGIGRCLGEFAVTGDERHRRAGRREGTGRDLPDPAGGPGHQYSSALEVHAPRMAPPGGGSVRRGVLDLDVLPARLAAVGVAVGHPVGDVVVASQDGEHHGGREVGRLGHRVGDVLGAQRLPDDRFGDGDHPITLTGRT